MGDCPDCKVGKIRVVESRSGASVSVVFGALLFIAGVLALLFSPIVGLLMVLVGIVMCSMGGKRSVAVCLSCGYRKVVEF